VHFTICAQLIEWISEKLTHFNLYNDLNIYDYCRGDHQTKNTLDEMFYERWHENGFFNPFPHTL